MLVTVLNCYQRDEVKWKNLSGQIMGLILPLLANQKVISANIKEVKLTNFITSNLRNLTIKCG